MLPERGKSRNLTNVNPFDRPPSLISLKCQRPAACCLEYSAADFKIAERSDIAAKQKASRVQWAAKVMTLASIRNTWKQGSLLLWPTVLKSARRGHVANPNSLQKCNDFNHRGTKDVKYATDKIYSQKFLGTWNKKAIYVAGYSGHTLSQKEIISCYKKKKSCDSKKCICHQENIFLA